MAYYLGYALGTVLFGWLVAMPALWLGRLLGLRNPWCIPILAGGFLLGLFGLIVAGCLRDASTPQDEIVCLGLLPAWIWSWGGWFRHRRARPGLEEMD